MGKLRIAITGATGLLGRNLLFEFIKQNLHQLDEIDVFILGRRSEGKGLKDRIEEIIREDGCLYCGTDRAGDILARIQTMEMDLIQEKLRLSREDYARLKSFKIDFFFHVAALTDFRSSPAVVEALYSTNVYGTKQIIGLVSTLKVGEFCYVGSAYSCGKVSGKIGPDYVKLDQEFRNPYEKTKLEAELLVREFSRSSGVKCRFFRPSTIGGRLMEAPLGAVCKFDVFYSCAAWFVRMKMKMFQQGENIYDTPLSLDIRVCCNLTSGLNIVPVDYAAKAMYQVCMQDGSVNDVHLVNVKETPHTLYIPLMMKMLNVTGVKTVDFVPDDKNKVESFYYKTIGNVFTPYMNDGRVSFDTKNLTSILSNAGLACPKVDEANFEVLLNYAKKFNFGINK